MRINELTMKEKMELINKIEECAGEGLFKTEAAEYLDISVYQLNKLIREGEIDYPVHRTIKEDHEVIRLNYGLVSTSKIAEAIGFSPDTVRRWAKLMGLYVPEERKDKRHILDIFKDVCPAYQIRDIENLGYDSLAKNSALIKLIVEWRNALSQVGSLETYFDNFIKACCYKRFGIDKPVIYGYQFDRLEQWGVPLEEIFCGITRKEEDLII